MACQTHRWLSLATSLTSGTDSEAKDAFLGNTPELSGMGPRRSKPLPISFGSWESPYPDTSIISLSNLMDLLARECHDNAVR